MSNSVQSSEKSANSRQDNHKIEKFVTLYSKLAEFAAIPGYQQQERLGEIHQLGETAPEKDKHLTSPLTDPSKLEPAKSNISNNVITERVAMNTPSNTPVRNHGMSAPRPLKPQRFEKIPGNRLPNEMSKMAEGGLRGWLAEALKSKKDKEWDEKLRKIHKEDELEQQRAKYDSPPVPMETKTPIYGGIGSHENDPNVSRIESNRIPANEVGHSGVTTPGTMLRQVYGDRYEGELNKAHEYNQKNGLPVDLTKNVKLPTTMMVSGDSGNIEGQSMGPTMEGFGVVGINKHELNNMRSDNPFFGYAPLRDQRAELPVVKDDRGIPEFKPIGNVQTPPKQNEGIDYSKNTYNVANRSRVAVPHSSAYEHELTHVLYPAEAHVEGDYTHSYPTAKKQRYHQVSESTPNASYFGSMPHERTTGIAAIQRDMFNNTGKRLNTPDEFKKHVNGVLGSGNVEGELKGSRPDTLRYFRNIAPIPEPQRTNLINQDAFKAPGVVQNRQQNNQKVARQRSTNVYDVSGNEFTNDEDVELLGKLGYSISLKDYSRLPKVAAADLYSYVEKVAGVPKAVARAVDKGEAFSGSFLKDMEYSVPKGYEVKGDLCCPVEKTALLEKESSEKPGLWANIRAKKARGERPAKPGDEAYPDKKQWDKLSKAGEIIKAAVAAWQRSEGKNPEGGLNAKGRASYKRETGGTLKAPVTESNPKGERASRQHSFCSRMCGMKSKNTGSEGKKDPDSRINKSLRKWNCKCGEAHDNLFEKLACAVKEAKGRCWEGYEPVPGKEAYSEDSCRPKGEKKDKEKKAAADTPVTSSNLKAVGYDKKDKALEVLFHSGSEYKYNGVPASLYRRLLKVKSPGKFLNKYIKKDDKYPYEKLLKTENSQNNSKIE
jgi:hypothetical protein